jgi:hypothetical protein
MISRIAAKSHDRRRIGRLLNGATARKNQVGYKHSAWENNMKDR